MENDTPKQTGRPAFSPTPDHYAKVSAMAGQGFPHEQIATILGISKGTLRKHFRKELPLAPIEANFAVTQNLFQMATGPSVTAAIFWVKNRTGFTSTTPPAQQRIIPKFIVEGPDGQIAE